MTNPMNGHVIQEEGVVYRNGWIDRSRDSIVIHHVIIFDKNNRTLRENVTGYHTVQN